MTTTHVMLTALVLALLWVPGAPNPLRDIQNRDDDSVRSWDYQSDVYDNRVIDDVQSEKVASKLMRPVPSNNLPVLTIQFPGNNRDKMPTEKDLDETILLKLIGSEIDERFSSITQPIQSILFPNGTMETNYKKGLPKDELPEEIQHLKFTLPGSDRTSEMRIKSPLYRRLLRQYLWANSYCPVVYKWKDLGERFWPRWINEGDCYREKSCSIPEGMTCKASESTYFTLLWWHCRSKSRCKWIPFKYPIITKCDCGC